MVVLGLGSNCGDRLDFLRQAISRIRAFYPKIRVVGISAIYESDALLPPGASEAWNQPFLNLNLLCQTTLVPTELLKVLKEIEVLLGRQARDRWAPREIDIDILAIDSLVFETESLKIPHPSLQDRPFAMLPFADLVPDWKFPQESHVYFDKRISDVVSHWRRKSAEETPYRTQRTPLFFTQLVGILNITPDSFSDGGMFFSSDSALEKIAHFVSNGVSVVDIGAESTRPGAMKVTPEEEWNRLQPILETVRSKLRGNPSSIKISVDTRNSEIARRAILSGADWINDVTGLEDREMRKAIANSSVDIVIMHSLTVPPNKDIVLSNYIDPVSTLMSWGETRIKELNQSGISRDRIIFDPGIGFGKTIAQTWEILRHINRFQELGVRVLVGHSRKSFLSSITRHIAAERDAETLSLSLNLAEKGVNYLRIHNSDLHSRALKAWSQIGGVTRCQ